MKKFILLLIVLVFGQKAWSQTYCNEWIKYNQQYAKFPIYKEGLYRIDSACLAQKFNLANLNPKNLQLFIWGKEQSIYFKGDADNKINTGDYLEFYADPNMRAIDSLVYTNIKYMQNPYLSLFSDTVYAFITFNNSINNKRFTLETDTSAASYPSANYVYASAKFAPPSYYNDLKLDGNDTRDPAYIQSESFGDYTWIDLNYSPTPVIFTSTFSNLQAYNSSSVALPVHVQFTGSGTSKADIPQKDHHLLVTYLDINNTPQTLADTSYKGRMSFKITNTVDVRSIGQNSNFTFSCVPMSFNPGLRQFTFIGYLEMTYPRMLNFNNATFFRFNALDAVSASKHFHRFNALNLSNSSECILYDLTNGRRIVTKIAGNTIRAIIPNGGGQKACVIGGDSTFIKVKQLYNAGNNGYYSKYNTSTLNNPYVMVMNQKLASASNDYKTYRESPQGGSYNVIMADVDRLYEQFAFGVPRHPAALRNFFKFLNDSLSSKPKYILLLGKGVRYEDLGSGSGNQVQNLIPTFGIQSADAMLSAALSKNNQEIYVPEIPLGRVAATNNAELNIYLNKVKERESIDTAAWKKKVLHFVGGDDDALNKTLGRYMSELGDIARDTLFGAKVYTFNKNTTAPIQTDINDSIYRIINAGASLINFFGHGSASGFDQGADDPSKYNNQSRYPFVLGNSCHAGEIFIPNNLNVIKSVSENFLFTDKKGAIGFLSTNSYGIDVYLYQFSHHFYTALAGSKYGQGIGDVVQEAIKQTNKTSDSTLRWLSVNMILHGDPAIKIYPGNKPDYILKNYNVNFNLNKYTDSIGIKVVSINTGKAIHDTLGIRIRRYFPNGDTLTFIKKVLAPLNRDTLSFYTAIDFKRGFGVNEFDVSLDYQNKIAELNESNNNSLGKISLFIPGGDIFPVYPYKYAVVPKTNKITLKASTTDPFCTTYNYRFQLDTCDAFTNPLQSNLISSKGGVLEWEVNLPMADSTVYFWRVSKDSVGANGYYNWRESSFQTIGTQRGWAQSHFHQFKNDNFSFINYNKKQRIFEFNNSINSIVTRNLVCRTMIDFPKVSYYFNSNKMDDTPCLVAAWNFAVFDSISNQPDFVRSLTYPQAGFGQYGNSVCYDNSTLRVYTFGGWGANTPYYSSKYKRDILNFLNSIPNGKYVLGYSVMYDAAPTLKYYPYYTAYSNALYSAFESLGVKNMRSTPDSLPYIFFGRKGMRIGEAHETIGKNDRDTISQNDIIQTKWSSGYLSSEIIGPSNNWKSLHWSVRGIDKSKGDTTLISVFGLNGLGRYDSLVTFKEDSLNILDLSRYANASKYPYLKLVAQIKDSKNLTAPQLRYWQVLYDEAPECAINPLKGFASINDNLQEGDNVTFRFPIENIGVKNFQDSLMISYWIEDKQHNKLSLPTKYTRKPFLPGEVLIDTLRVNSYQLNGENALWINVNPLNQLKYQAEQYQFNNIGRYPFVVSKDVTNPLLDVTFDGVRILNGDIVSAKPNILISLKDENKFLALNDTSSFKISLKAPNQSTAQAVYFARDLEFNPANLPNNNASILFNPNLVTDGRYTLFVKAKDRSNNASGAKDFQIDFEVNNQPSITGVLNYPNPFSTATRFVFTLTGSEIPEVFTIQIMTISGKIVREITRGELGNLHIGRNITDFAWDGKDNYGDKLANGVYLYRVITKLNGQDVQKNASGADTYMMKDFGKMVIMR